MALTAQKGNIQVSIQTTSYQWWWWWGGGPGGGMHVNMWASGIDNIHDIVHDHVYPDVFYVQHTRLYLVLKYLHHCHTRLVEPCGYLKDTTLLAFV